MTYRRPRAAAVVLLCIAAAACTVAAPTPSATPTPADAKSFLDNVNATLLKLGIAQGQAGWVQQTYITQDTEAISARANQEFADAIARFAKEATKFDKVEVPPDQRRQLTLLKVSLVMAPPSDPKESEELSKILAGLQSSVREGQMVPRPVET